MSDNSDTESEPESSLPKCTATDFAQAHKTRERKNTEDSRDNSGQSAIAAVETLNTLDLLTIQKDTSLHEVIQGACDDILRFLDDVLATSNSSGDQNVHGDLIALADILQPSVMSTLFRYRQIFHRIASQAVVPGTAAPINICWVDVLLVKLSEAAVFVASGFNPADTDRLSLQSLKARREEDNLLAASQLPHKWQSVIGIIASEHASPAARRLALRLVFASYVMVPELKTCNPREDSDIPPVEIAKTLQAYLRRLSETQGAIDHHEFVAHERIAYAMIISLFATTDSRTTESSSFRPHTLTTLLSLMQFVMHPSGIPSSSDLTHPMEILDPAQTILVRWGQTIPFCWTIWDNEKVVHMECITHLSATWLFHLGDDPFEPRGDDDPGTWKERLASCLLKNPIAANSVILQSLQSNVQTIGIQQGNIQPTTLNVLLKSCWAIAQLVNPVSMNGWMTPTAVRTCELLCNLLVLLGGSEYELNVKELLIESLTFLESDALLIAIDRLQKDTKIHFVTKLEDLIIQAKRKFTLENRASIRANDICATNNILHFLAIIWHGGADGGVHHHTLSRILTPLVDWLSNESSRSLPRKTLLSSLLTALAMLEELRSEPMSKVTSKFRLWDDESIWQLATESCCSDLLVANAFAHLLLATPKDRLCDSLACAEAWNYLRDVILLILSHHFLGDDEPLALMISPVICNTLLLLLQEGQAAVHFILSSPWTMNLCTALQDLFKGDSPSEYSSILAARLESVGTILLNEMARKTQPDANSNIYAGPSRHGVRLMFCKIRPKPTLILVSSP